MSQLQTQIGANVSVAKQRRYNLLFDVALFDNRLIILPKIITIVLCVINRASTLKSERRNTCRGRYLRNLFASPFPDPFTLRPLSLPFTAPTYPFSPLESWSRTL